MRKIKKQIILPLMIATFVSILNPLSSVAGDSSEMDARTEGKEIVYLREEYGKHYEMPDGTFQYVGYINRIHYRDENGAFQDIDNSIIEDAVVLESGQYSYRNKASDITVRFSNDNVMSEFPVLLEYEDCVLGINEIDSFISERSIDECKWLSEWEGFVDFNCIKVFKSESGHYLMYAVTEYGVKEYIVLTEPETQDSIEYQVYVNNLDIDLSNIGNVKFNDKEGQYSFELGKLFAYDADGSFYDGFDEEINLVDSSSLKYKITLNNEWMNSEERIYPIVIDPTITLSSPSEDTTICSGYPGINYGSSTLLRTGYLPNFAVCRSLIRFEMPTSLEPSQVITAMLRIKQSTGANPSIYAHNITSSWSEMGVTWNSQPGYDNASVYSKAIKVSNTTDWYSVNLYGIINDWFLNPSANRGIELIDTIESATTDWSNFYSSEAAADNRPMLIISYANLQAILYGVPATGHDHSTCINSAKIYLQNIGYTTSQAVTTATATKEYINNVLNGSNQRIFMSRSHGLCLIDWNTGLISRTLLLLEDTGDNPTIEEVEEMIEYYENVSQYSSLDLAEKDLSAKTLFVFCGCYTGFKGLLENQTTNLVDVAVQQGATTAIGFQGSICCNYANQWFEDFCEMMEDGETVAETCAFLGSAFATGNLNSYYIAGYGDLTLN